MGSEEDINRFRYRTRVQAVAVIDILVGTIPFIKLAFAFNDKHLADLYQDRHYLVLLWSVLLCVYVLQLIMGIWLLAATREVYSEYTVGNCQVWFYVALFTFAFYTGEMAFAISTIISSPSSQKSIKQVFMTMSYHALKIIYRAFTLMVVNNFLYDVCRPVYRYLSQGSFQYKYYYHSRLGIPLPTRRTSVAATAAFPIQCQPNYRYYSTYPQPLNKLPPDNSRSQPHRLNNPHPPYPYATNNNLRMGARTNYPMRPNVNSYYHYNGSPRVNYGSRRPLATNPVADSVWVPEAFLIPFQ